MNLLQLARKAQLEVDAIRTGNVASDLWSNEEIYDAVNTAMDRAARIIRLADSDLLTKRMRSTDAVVDLISESYAPSSFRLADGTATYTLPPDFVRLVTILPTTVGFEGVRIRPAALYLKHFVDQRVIPTEDIASSNNSDQVFWYIILGQRTLLLAPTPKDAIDLELFYQYRSPRLLSYTTSTVDLTYNSTSVKGKVTDWLTAGVRTPVDLIVGQTTPAGVDLNRYYPRVSSITDDATLVLNRAYPGATVAGSSYTLAMIPEIPEEHHSWLAQVAAALMFRKVDPTVSKALMDTLEAELRSEVQPELGIRQMQESLVTEPFELPG